MQANPTLLQCTDRCRCLPACADQLFADAGPHNPTTNTARWQKWLYSGYGGLYPEAADHVDRGFSWATLEEISRRLRSLLIHVVDVRIRMLRAQIEAVEDTLAEIEMPRVPRILALQQSRSGSGRIAEVCRSRLYRRLPISSLKRDRDANYWRKLNNNSPITWLRSIWSCPIHGGGVLISLISTSSVLWEDEQHTESRCHEFADVSRPASWRGFQARSIHEAGYNSFDRSVSIKNLIKWLSTSLASRRGLPVLAAIVLTVVSLIVHIIAAISGNVLVSVLRILVLHIRYPGWFPGRVALQNPLAPANYHRHKS